jgi:uncharacterized protein YfaS (alpha-2-macroglobulin family)
MLGGPVPALRAKQASNANEQEKLAEKKADEKNPEEKNLAKDKDAAADCPPAAPPSLYFNPNLQTDANGAAIVRFSMPAGATEYRILIDALGQGRIGSRQELISAP